MATLPRSLLLLAVLAVPVADTLDAQTDTTRIMIAGLVVDPLQKPIEGAEVRVVGRAGSTMTSAAGSFRLFVPKSQEILLQIRRPGYKATLLKLDGEWSGTVLLTPGTFELPEVQVTARYAKPSRYAHTSKYDDYFQRRRLGLGEFISREDIERRAPLQTVDLLSGRPGIRVDMRQGFEVGGGGWPIVIFSRCNEYPPKINVYIDGHKMQPPRSAETDADGASPLMLLRSGGLSPEELTRRREIRMRVGEMLSRISPSDIELVEIFRGPGELPAEFNDGNCGAIAMWTRQGAP